MKLSECYRLLNASPNMEWNEIKKSYHSLAKRFHPDLQPQDSASSFRFRRITQAFEVLENLNRSRPHPVHEETAPQDAPASSSPPSRKEPIAATPLFQKNREKKAPAKRSPGILRRLRMWLFNFERKYLLLDLKQKITISPRLAAMGCSIRVRKGSERFQVRIPRGPWNRLFLRIPGKGNFSLLAFLRGDLLLEILVEQGKEVAVRESEFFYKIRVPKHEVRWGKVFTLNSVHGPIRFTLPKTAGNGEQFVVEAPRDTKSVASAVFGRNRGEGISMQGGPATGVSPASAVNPASQARHIVQVQIV